MIEEHTTYLLRFSDGPARLIDWSVLLRTLADLQREPMRRCFFVEDGHIKEVYPIMGAKYVNVLYQKTDANYVLDQYGRTGQVEWTQDIYYYLEERAKMQSSTGRTIIAYAEPYDPHSLAHAVLLEEAAEAANAEVSS